jgi:transposase
LTDEHGIPLSIVVAGANRHDMKLTCPTLENVEVKRPEPTNEHPQGLCLDKGYDYNEVRALAKEFGFTAHIVPRGKEAQMIKKQLVLRPISSAYIIGNLKFANTTSQ